MAGDLKFHACDMFVTKEEVLYFSDQRKKRILRLSPGESQPIIVGEVPEEHGPFLAGLFVEEGGKIYVADTGSRKLWCFNPGDVSCHEVSRRRGTH